MASRMTSPAVTVLMKPALFMWLLAAQQILKKKKNANHHLNLQQVIYIWAADGSEGKESACSAGVVVV